MPAFRPLLRLALASVLLVACGARSGLIAPDVADVVAIDAPVRDGFDVLDVADVRDVPDVRDVVRRDVPDGSDACVPADDQCGAMEVCGNGVDDDCDGHVDQGCGCTPGEVQSCFAGPPGRRNLGACQDGAQTCLMSGAWGECTGGIVPRDDVCNGEDNLCDGCSQQNDCPIMCPGPGDTRTPDAQPFEQYRLRGEQFYMGPARSWSWIVQGGPCDAISRNPSFQVLGAGSQDATFVPLLSGDYTITLTVVTAEGHTLTCTWIVHVIGPGLRVEMCYPENTTVDLDLYLHNPHNNENWWRDATNVFLPTADAACDWSNCEATIRGDSDGDGIPDYPRANWGLPSSPLSSCVNGPHGAEWRLFGSCANPRLDIDNNLEKTTGSPENINVDNPGTTSMYRIMVQDFSGLPSHPLVNVYCSGRRVVTYGAPPDAFVLSGAMPNNIGAMWRVADVTVHVNAAGVTTCNVTQLHPPGTTRGYWVTNNNPVF